MSTMNISGILIPTNPASGDASEEFAAAVQRSALWLLAEEGNKVDSNGTIEMNRSIEVPEVHQPVRSFITGLKTFLQEETIVQLELSGVLIIAIDTDAEPFLMRVNVRNGKIFYQDGYIRWNPETPF